MSLGNREYDSGARHIVEVSTWPNSANQPDMSARASGLAAVGVIAMLLGIWGGLVPFIGPSFGFSADGSGAWRLTAAHVWLGVLPGAVAFIAGILMLGSAPRTVSGSGRRALVLSGILGLLAGSWFVVGPQAWLVVTSASRYFVGAVPLRELAFQIVYAFGPGVLVLAAGAFSLGWSARHVPVTLAVSSGPIIRAQPIADSGAVDLVSPPVGGPSAVAPAADPSYERPI